MKSLSIFNVTSVEFSLFLPLCFSPCSYIYGGIMVVLCLEIKKSFCFLTSIQIKKIQAIEVERESMRKKKKGFSMIHEN